MHLLAPYPKRLMLEVFCSLVSKSIVHSATAVITPHERSFRGPWAACNAEGPYEVSSYGSSPGTVLLMQQAHYHIMFTTNAAASTDATKQSRSPS